MTAETSEKSKHKRRRTIRSYTLTHYPNPGKAEDTRYAMWWYTNMVGGSEQNHLRVGAFRIIYAIFDRDGLVLVGKIARREKDTYDRLEELF